MKGKHPKITLLGNNSGRNLGDAAILSSILDSLSSQLPEVEFYVPSIFPKWIDKNYADKYNVKGINVMPWTLSLRLLGLPTLICMAKSDLALICDGIIFGKKLLNPAFNYLITLIFLVPFAKLFNCKLVCFNCGIGPFPSKLSRWCAKYVINASDMVTMRENDSKTLAEEIGVTVPMELAGDSAFINPVSSAKRAKEVASEIGIDLSKPTLAVNITSYIDTWLKKDERVADKDQFIAMLAEGINAAKKAVNSDFQLLVVSTQPMDEKISYRFAEMIGAKVIDNTRYLSHDLQAIMRECQLLIGMRFHSLVLASAVRAPIVGLIYAPKVRGYMRLLDCEKYGLELAELSADKLKETLVDAWQERDTLRERQMKVVDQLMEGAQLAARALKQRFYPELEEHNSPQRVANQ